VNLRFIDWIWHIRGSLALAPGQSSRDVFDRLDPLFHQRNTSHQKSTDTLTFSKKDQDAQDKMSIFDHGVLRIEQGVAGPVLRYHLVSRALLACFLAPFLFLIIAQFTVGLNKLDKPSATAKAEAAKKPPVRPMNPIDKFLHAPAPDTSKKDDAGGGGKKGKPSPTPAYVFAGIFATLYVGGRILEDRLVKRLFRKTLPEVDAASSANAASIMKLIQ
jgi:hypothetical protein